MTIAGRLHTAVRPYRVRPTRATIRRFAASIGATDPSCFDVSAARAAGHPDLLAPPTYLFGLDMEQGRVFDMLESAGADPRDCLHVEQEFIYGAPVHAGRALVFTPTFDTEGHHRRGMEFLTRRTVVHRDDGTEVAALRQVIAVPSPADGTAA
ncbi:FAS1-like dehydratase domain-containing protein [Streptomyces otsuchiensis]|uniref:FAS1-like dehydratase domain-containing protein n=1 Tax=Streptomyces otsuchiensis TaxID=2681388 RepID=UPI0013009C46|nr:MaoC family dehydratase N-terminal domain-containing protein [Streptomyces otsuchiensis]